MADQDKSLPIATDSTSTSSIADLKGKGKASDAAVQDVSMDEDEDTSEDDTAAEEEVVLLRTSPSAIIASQLISNSTDS